jgi:hypothetical protein
MYAKEVLETILFKYISHYGWINIEDIKKNEHKINMKEFMSDIKNHPEYFSVCTH